MLSFVVSPRLPPLYALCPRSSRHRDENPVTATPLECVLTKRDARDPFRIGSYENCRVVYPSPFLFASRIAFAHREPICKSNVFYALRSLPSSVSRKSFPCHSYENNRGMVQLFPQWNLPADFPSVPQPQSTRSSLAASYQLAPTFSGSLIISHQSQLTSHLSCLTPSRSADTINSSPTEPGHAGRSRGGFP
jgi:hypothetical protein